MSDRQYEGLSENIAGVKGEAGRWTRNHQDIIYPRNYGPVLAVTPCVLHESRTLWTTAFYLHNRGLMFSLGREKRSSRVNIGTVGLVNCSFEEVYLVKPEMLSGDQA